MRLPPSFARDAFAGLVLTAMLLPAGMGYATASGLPPITGLYATIIPLLVYAAIGPSKILVLGPDSALAALIAAAIAGPSGGDPARAIELAALLALMVGVVHVVGGFARAGLVASLLSKPVRVGYMHGLAITMLVTQLPGLLGFSVPGATSVADGLGGLAFGIYDGQVNPIALGIGGGCLVVILTVSRFAKRIPGVLIAIASATIAVVALDLRDDVKVIGEIPSGIPLPSLPALDLASIRELIVPAFGIALVALADTSILSRTFAARQGRHVDPNRELIGLGAANFSAAWFQGFPVSASSSRTPVAEALGAKTQIANVVAALALAVNLAAVPWLLHDLPRTALSAVVIAAAIGMIDLPPLRRLWIVRKSDFAFAVLGMIAVVLLGVIPGIVFAVGISLLDFIRRAWRPHDAVLGRAPKVKGYHDIRRYEHAEQIPGLVLFRWDAPLFFANADTFRERVTQLVETTTPKPTWFVIAAEPITDVDTTAAEMIETLDAELEKAGITLAFAELKDPVRDRLRRYELEQKIGLERFYPTIGVAVKEYLEATGTVWIDWEDR